MTGVSYETADAIWLGHDPEGFCRLARMVASELHHNNLPDKHGGKETPSNLRPM